MFAASIERSKPFALPFFASGSGICGFDARETLAFLFQNFAPHELREENAYDSLKR
jgi:hypothetical protein